MAAWDWDAHLIKSGGGSLRHLAWHDDPHGSQGRARGHCGRRPSQPRGAPACSRSAVIRIRPPAARSARIMAGRVGALQKSDRRPPQRHRRRICHQRAPAMGRQKPGADRPGGQSEVLGDRRICTYVPHCGRWPPARHRLFMLGHLYLCSHCRTSARHLGDDFGRLWRGRRAGLIVRHWVACHGLVEFCCRCGCVGGCVMVVQAASGC